MIFLVSHQITKKDRRASEIISEDIVNEVYKSISLEYNAKFEKN